MFLTLITPSPATVLLGGKLNDGRHDAHGKWLRGTSTNPEGGGKGRGLRAGIERKLAEVAAGSSGTRMARIAQVRGNE